MPAPSRKYPGVKTMVARDSCADAALHLRGGEPRQVLDLDGSLQLRYGGANSLSPESIPFGRSEDDHQLPGVRLKVQGEIERRCRRRVEVHRLADDIGRQRHSLQLIPGQGDVYDRHPGQHAVAGPDHELDRVRCRCNDHADVAPGVFAAQEFRLRVGVSLHRRSLDVEILGIHLDGTLQQIGHHPAQRVLDDDGRQCRALVAVDDQHAGRRGLGGMRGERADDKRRERRRRAANQSSEIVSTEAIFGCHGVRAANAGRRQFCPTRVQRTSPARRPAR